MAAFPGRSLSSVEAPSGSMLQPLDRLGATAMTAFSSVGYYRDRYGLEAESCTWTMDDMP